MTPEVSDRIKQIRLGNIPEGYKKGKLGVVPEDWEEVPFSSLFTSTSEYTDDLARYPLCSLTIEDGITAKTERYERSHLVKKQNAYKVVRPNDYAYNPMNIRFGAVSRHKGDIPVAVSGYYDIFTTVHKSDLAFIDVFLTCGPMITYYNKVSIGSLIEKKRVHFSDFLAFSIDLPPIDERQKIAKIVATQDKIIDLWNRKIEQLRQLKKLCLRKMFPRGGSDVPEVRFPGFTGAWNWQKMEDVFKPLQNTPLPRSELSETHGIVGNIHYGDILTKFHEILDLSLEFLPFIRDNNIANRYSSSLLQDGDIIMADTAEDESVGKCCEVCGITNQKVLAGLHTIPLRPINHFVPRYLGYYMNTPSFHKQLIPLMQGVKVASLPKNNLFGANIAFPNSKREQSRISSFFHVFDSIISLHQRRLAAEEEKKKALMQLLLTGIVRV